MWLESDKGDNIELPSHSESLLPLEVACSPVSNETNFLFENPVITLPGANALKRVLIPLKIHLPCCLSFSSAQSFSRV